MIEFAVTPTDAAGDVQDPEEHDESHNGGHDRANGRAVFANESIGLPLPDTGGDERGHDDDGRTPDHAAPRDLLVVFGRVRNVHLVRQPTHKHSDAIAGDGTDTTDQPEV